MKKIAILSDFSKTLTAWTNPTTWSVFAKSWLLWEWYISDRNKYFDENYHFEVAWNKEWTEKWFRDHLLLFKKHWLTQKLIEEIVRDEKYFKPRKWLKKFFEKIFSDEVKNFSIISSWIKNFIEEFLIYQKINLEKIKIIAWELTLDENWIVNWCSERALTPLNKWDFTPDFSEFDKVILLWDDEWDLKMINWDNFFTIWFYDREKADWFDVYLGKDWSLEEVLEIVEGLKK